MARVRLYHGKGNIEVNGKNFEDYFPMETLRYIVRQPLNLCNCADLYDIKVNVKGGGISGQSGAVRHVLPPHWLMLIQISTKPF